MKNAVRVALFLSMATLLGACQSGSTPPAPSVQTQTPEQIVEHIKKTLAKDYPGMEIQSVKALEGIPNVYEVHVDSDIVYMDATAKYAFIGQLVDVKTRVNLTEKTLQKQAEQAWKKLPFEAAIKEVRGDGKRSLVLFSDPDCPFCKRIEQSLQQMDNVTIYTFLTPIDELHPDATRKSKAIWCSEDRLKTWNGVMRNGETAPELKPLCNVPMAEWKKLQKQFKVHATPTLLFPNGKVIPGAVDKDGIEKVFDQIAAKAKKSST